MQYVYVTTEKGEKRAIAEMANAGFDLVSKLYYNGEELGPYPVRLTFIKKGQ